MGIQAGQTTDTSPSSSVAQPLGGSAPGPSQWTVFSGLRRVRNEPLEYCQELRAEYGDVVGFRLGPLRSYLLAHPDHLKHVLQENHHNYVKGEVIGRAKVLIGEGLFSSEGAFWRRQRRLMQPLFSRAALSNLVEPMAEVTAARLDSMAVHERSGDVFDLTDEMTALTLTIVGRTLFGLDLEGDARTVGTHLMRALAYINRRVTTPYAVPFAVPTPASVRFRYSRRELDSVVHRMISSRRRSGDRGDDLLSVMLDARDPETGDVMSDRQLRDETITFVLAGHETTAVALTWTWYLLAQHPEIEKAVREEVDRVLAGRHPTADNLPQLELTRRCVQEAMRLYPPLWGSARQALAPDRIGGFDIPTGAYVSLVPWMTHLDERFWPDPKRYDPDRFLPDAVAARPRFAYVPFSGGPRQCIGNEFALMEAAVAVSMMVQRYRVDLATDKPIDVAAAITLRPGGGVPVRLRGA
jgi:cytochrome P450